MSTPLLDPEFDAPFELSANDRLALLRAFERKVLWLSAWMIHHANHVRENADGLKVGGHQASCASVVTLMTALYLDTLRPHDRVAVKPHASPVFHALQYILGRQCRDQIERFRGLGGAQSYPSRAKDKDEVDFSTGSVGLGVATTSFAAMTQDYLGSKGWLDGRPNGRMIALVGDAELDEGNVYEALLEGWKHDVRNVWWIIDYNRQSLDAVIADHLFTRFDRLFKSMGWRVVTMKYGKRLQAAFRESGGEALRQWIDACPNSLYSALVFKGGPAWREHLMKDIGSRPGVGELLGRHDDEALATLMTNLGGHDMESVLEAFDSVNDEQPTCFIAYTIKGFGLPMAGHKDNHAGLMSPEQMEALRATHRIAHGEEWDAFAGLSLPPSHARHFLFNVPFVREHERRHRAPRIAIPARLRAPAGGVLSTQEAFGRTLDALAREASELADRIVTTSPDVTISTSLGGWVNRRGVYHREHQEDLFSREQVGSFQRWVAGPKGQHIELGIAENNLFLILGALGLSHSLFGQRLLPIGTVYDPFIERGLDALNYASYQDARFMLVATPSGLSLAPEGGAHQSIVTPLIGMAQPGLASFEPAYVDELALLMRWGFDYLQREGEGGAESPGDLLDDRRGGAVYLRLSTRKLEQPERELGEEQAQAIIAGGYWHIPPTADCPVAIVSMGATAPDAGRAHEQLAESHPGAALLAVTSPGRLHHGWLTAQRRRQEGDAAVSHVETLLDVLSRRAALVTVVDGHPATLSWLGAVRGHRIRALGVDRFGQSGNIPELYREYGIDAEAIVTAAHDALRFVG